MPPTALGTFLGSNLGTTLGWDSDASELAAPEASLSYSLFSWMGSDYYAISGGKVTSFWDKVAAGVGARAIDANHAFSQGTTGNQVVTPAADALFGNRLSAAFVVANNTYYDSSLSPTPWRFSHDGTGMYVYAICASTSTAASQVVTGTRTTSTGITLYRAQAGNVCNFYDGNVSTTVLGYSGASWVTNSAELWRWGYRTADIPDSAMVRKGTLSNVSNQLSAPASGDPQNTMRIGSDNFGNPFGGNMCDVMFVSGGPLDSTLDANVKRYAYLKYGIVSA